VVDLAATRTIEGGKMASKSGWTPFDGRVVKGWPVGTIIRGRRVMWEGEVIGPGGGEAVSFLAG